MALSTLFFSWCGAQHPSESETTLSCISQDSPTSRVPGLLLEIVKSTAL